MKLKNITLISFLLVFFLGTSLSKVFADLTPSGLPGEATQYTLNDIYTKLTTGNATSTKSGSIITPESVSATFRTLTEIYNAIPETLSIVASTTTVPVGINRATTTLDAIDTDLIASNILLGTNIFGIDGTVIDAGNIPGQTLSNSTTTVAYGVYATTTLDAIDTDLIPANIKQGEIIFGIEGSLLESTTLQWSSVQSANSWSSASTTCAGTIDGETGWRVPDISELTYAISEHFLRNNTNGFVANTYYWSSTNISEANAWAARYYSTGGYLNTINTPKTSNYAIRCVK